jgi:polyisoprenoid-binding protein YceI
MKTWKIDPVHSEIKFKVKHLVISTVTGLFEKFDGKLESENDDFTDSTVSFSADINSINTRNAQRDGHLKSADFFDAANNPKLKFVSRSFSKKSGSDNEFEMTGDMTIRGITKEVKFDVSHNGNAIGMDGSNLAGFEIAGKINRFDFGLEWNPLTEAGGLAVGKDITIEIFAEMKKEEISTLAA